MKIKKIAKTIIYHKVADVAIWKEVYDLFRGLRQKSGELSAEIGCFCNDPKTIYIINEWKSMAAAKAYFNNSELTKNMIKAGLIEKPQLLYLVRVEHVN